MIRGNLILASPRNCDFSSNQEILVNPIHFLNTTKKKGAAAICALVLCGGAVVARASFETSRVHLKLADVNEPPSRVTMAPAAKAAMPAVVKISASKMVKTQGGGMEMDPMLRQFFGGNIPQQAPRSHREGGLGSGVVVSPDGYILTNNHVVDAATDVRVTLADRREFKARVIGADPKSDIAVLKIDANNLTPITVGDSSKMQIGDAVLAIGNPYGVGQTVTMGIVSAMGRANLGIEEYEDFIQTDASINPGNSGGALVNDRGELVGINTAILAPGSGGNQGIGFAVPVNLARNVMDQITIHGEVKRSYLGVTIQEVTPALAKAMGLNGPAGALVSDVQADSPGQKAGLKSGDVITEINGKKILESNELRMNVSMMEPGQTVKLKVFRDGHLMDVTANVGAMPGKRVEKASNDSTSGEKAMEGVSVEELSAQDARQLGLPANTKGVVVTDVDPGSQAAAAGLQKGDVIQQVNRKPVTSADEFASAIRHSSGESLLLVNREGNKIFLAV
jgi:serine protease Do